MRAALLGALALPLALPLALGAAPAYAADDDPEDLTPPVLTITRQDGGVDGWYADTTSVFVRATDTHLNASGVRTVSWMMTGAQQDAGTVSRTAGGNVAVAADGWTRLDVEAVDGNDNATAGWVEVGIDRAPPTVAFSGKVVDGAQLVQGTSATLTFACADAQVGLGGCVGTFLSGTPVDTSVLGPQTVSVEAWDRLGNRVTRSITFTVVDDEFTVGRLPEIAGTPAFGQTLTAVDPQVSPAATGHTYEWLRETDGVTTVVGTATTYAVTPADGGSHLRVRVTPVREGVAPRPLTSLNVTVPRGQIDVDHEAWLVGSPVVGQQLRVADLVVRSPSSVAVAYTWLRDGAVIGGETNRWYFPVAADRGHRISARVQITSPGYEPRTWTTPETESARAPALEVLGDATVQGTARVGELLQAVPPRIQVPAEQRAPGDPATLSFQWLRDGAPIAGAGAATYRLRPADAGRRIAVRVRGTLPEYEDAVVTSEPSPAVAIGVPGVTATARPGAPGKVRLQVVVRLPGATPTGKIVVSRNGRVVARGVLRNGVLRATLTRQPRGKVTYAVRYAGAPGIAARTVTVVTRVR